MASWTADRGAIHNGIQVTASTESCSSSAQGEEEEEVRPASPKYDERSFFYTTPAAFKPAALSGRPQTQWTTEGSFLGAAHHQPPQRPNAQSASQAAGPLLLDTHQQQQQQQQHQQQQQQEPQNRLRANPAGTHEVSPSEFHQGWC